jgi:hypothetical protein
VELILLDWTRMGKQYCLAGVIEQGGQFRVVRPLLARHRNATVRNVGWSPFHMDGYSRWEIFDMVRPEQAEAQPPHLEDVWAHELRPRRRHATPGQRRAILQATLIPPDQALFGQPLKPTRTAAFLEPGCGCRSLASVTLPAATLDFSSAWRDGADEPDFRVSLVVPGLGSRTLPVKDHFLLRQAELAGNEEAAVRALGRAVRQMGEQVVVRLGLSRPYPPDKPDASCWLMADGFFSASDPQP